MTSPLRSLRTVLRLPTRLEWRIAGRYLRSRRNSRAASLNTVISTGGVIVGVTALIVVLGVMNGLRNDLRERILVANPHLRVLTYGAGLRVDDWRNAMKVILSDPDVVAAAPEVITQSIITRGADYAEAINVVGFEPDTGKVSDAPVALSTMLFPCTLAFGCKTTLLISNNSFCCMPRGLGSTPRNILSASASVKPLGFPIFCKSTRWKLSINAFPNSEKVFKKYSSRYSES
jgi:hypothetical protein